MMVSDGGTLRAVVDPTRGAKIVSLISSDGREWLAQASADANREPGTPFVNAEMAGWDECAPSIVSCDFGGVHIPDHGDLWDFSFSVVGSTLSGRGGSLDYQLDRSIQTTATGLKLMYSAVARNREIPFLWAAHPQFRAPPGARVELPGLDHVVFDVLKAPPTPRAWTNSIRTIDSVEIGAARKVYLDPHHPVFSASIVHADGARLRMSWDDACPYLGIWYDNCLYSREAVIALEPSTGYFDSLARAAATDRVAILTPGKPLCWELKLDVETL